MPGIMHMNKIFSKVLAKNVVLAEEDVGFLVCCGRQNDLNSNERSQLGSIEVEIISSISAAWEHL